LFRNFKTIETLYDLLTVNYSNGVKRLLKEQAGKPHWMNFLKKGKL